MRRWCKTGSNSKSYIGMHISAHTFFTNNHRYKIFSSNHSLGLIFYWFHFSCLFLLSLVLSVQLQFIQLPRSRLASFALVLDDYSAAELLVAHSLDVFHCYAAKNTA